MNYEATLQDIFSTSSFRPIATMEHLEKVLEELGNPQKKLRFVHVAGTNGKGSITTMLANVLTKNGYKTGKFISPFIVDFRERVQIENQMIAQEDLMEFHHLVRVAEKSAEACLTQFELICAIALAYFAHKACDIVVLEVGIGGRDDATNIIPTPLVAVIASISLDHTAILGDTTEKIALVKAGIIKIGGDVVGYPLNDEGAMKVLKEVAQKQEAHLHIPKVSQLKNVCTSFSGNSFEYFGEEFTLKLLGEHQVYNCITALEAIKVLKAKGLIIDDALAKQAIGETTFYCRQELVGAQPTFFIDGAHNTDAARLLAQSFRQYQLKDLVCVVAFMKDKDWQGIIKTLKNQVRKFIFVPLSMPRALEAEEMSEFCRLQGVRCVVANSAKEAVILAKQLGEEVIPVFGSLYLASEIRSILTQKE